MQPGWWRSGRDLLSEAEVSGIVFRDGPIGRRDGRVGGPDVWEVGSGARVRPRCGAELAEEEILALVAANPGLPMRLVRTAVLAAAAAPGGATWSALPAALGDLGRRRLRPDLGCGGGGGRDPRRGDHSRYRGRDRGHPLAEPTGVRRDHRQEPLQPAALADQREPRTRPVRHRPGPLEPAR